MKILFTKYFKFSIYLLVYIGFNVSYAGSYDDFFKAIKMDDVRTIQQLLNRGFDANTLDPQGQHGLLVAIKEPSPKVVKTLVDAPKIDLNTLNVLGESPLMLASLKGELELATQMVKKARMSIKPAGRRCITQPATATCL